MTTRSSTGALPATTTRPLDLRSTHRISRTARLSAVIVSLGIVASSAYALLADDPYRDLSDATVVAAKAQDVCSVLVAGVLLWLIRTTVATRAAHLLRVGLLAYVAYSYAIYLTGVPMNRAFLVYVVIESAALAGLVEGLLRLTTWSWPLVSQRLSRGTGWMLSLVAVLFTGLWLSALVPYALGGATPEPAGVGGAPYPVYVLDLVVVLPCILAVGVLLLQGRPLAGPLAVVALVKILTLFGALWAGVLVGLATGEDVELGADAGPSVLMLVASAWLLVRWLRALTPARTTGSPS